MDAAIATGKVENLGETGMQAKEEWWYPGLHEGEVPRPAELGGAEGAGLRRGVLDARDRAEGPLSRRAGDLGRLRRGARRGARTCPSRWSMPAPTRRSSPSWRAPTSARRRSCSGSTRRTGRRSNTRASGSSSRNTSRPATPTRPGASNPDATPRLRQAARADLEGRLGRREGQVAGRLRRRSRPSRSTTTRWAQMIAKVDLDGQDGRATWSAEWMAANEARWQEWIKQAERRRSTVGVGRWPVRAESKLACRGVWKLFGPRRRGFLRRLRRPPAPDDVAAAGLIAAVRDVEPRGPRRRDLRHHGPVRLGQVDAGALPVAPGRADRRRGPVRRARTCCARRRRAS